MNVDLVFTIINIIMAGMFGAVIGSFTNVCIYRIPEHRTIVKGHSMCMTCGHELGALDLVPIFSWLFLGGKCRYCKTPISSRYIKIESLTGLMYILMAVTHLSMFLDPVDPKKNLFPFIVLCALFIMINIVIVEMMIMKDTGSSMYNLSVALLIDLAVQVLFRAMGPALSDKLGWTVSSSDKSTAGLFADILIEILIAAAIGLLAVVLAIMINCLSKKSQSYFKSDKMKALRTSDLFAIILCGCIGVVPAIVCAVVYLISRCAIGNGRNVKYLGTLLAAGAAVGYFGYAFFNMLFG